MRHSQITQMVNARGLSAWCGSTVLRQCQEFSLVFYTTGSRHGEVTMVHLINHDVISLRCLVAMPPFRIRGAKVEDSASLAAHTYGVSIDSRVLTQPFSCMTHIEGIELSVLVTSYRSVPSAVVRTLHGDSLHGFSTLGCRIEI